MSVVGELLRLACVLALVVSVAAGSAEAAPSGEVVEVRACLARGDFAGALDACDRALATDGSSQVFNYLRGVALFRLKRHAEARTALERAREAGDGPELLLALGSVHVELQDWERAVATFKALAELKTSAKVQERLAFSLWKAGRDEEALEAARAGLALAPESRRLLDFVARLERETAAEANHDTRETRSFAISFEKTESQREVAARVSDLAERALGDVERALWPHDGGTIQVVVYPTGAQYRSASGAPSWSAARWDGKLRVAVEALREGDDETLLPTLRHELAHALVSRRVSQASVPAWLNEGLAQHVEGRERPDHESVLRKRLASRTKAQPLLSFSSLAGSFGKMSDANSARLAYAQSRFAVEFLLESQRMASVLEVLDQLQAGQTFEDAFRRGVGWDEDAFTAKFTAWLRERFHLGS